jgi:hypothetical protein
MVSFLATSSNLSFALTAGREGDVAQYCLSNATSRAGDVAGKKILIVPKGVEHRPHTNGELVFNLLFEPKATQHTGIVESDMTVKELDWI